MMGLSSTGKELLLGLLRIIIFIFPSTTALSLHAVPHRNIRDFMVQGGDPTGTGKGGESVHGGFMDDEFHPALKVK